MVATHVPYTRCRGALELGGSRATAAVVTTFPDQRDHERARTRGFVVAWVFAPMFYFLEYAVRSSPSVMIPELANAFGITALGVSAILGVYCYTYSTVSLVVGAALDRLGGKRSILCSDPRSRMSVVTHYLPRSQEAITAFEARSPD